jgi:hypothetical protein
MPFKAEKGHRVRGYSKKHFALANSTKTKHFSAIKVDYK